MAFMLTPKDFFNLESYAHAELFEGCSYVWEALARLESYLDGKKQGKIEVEIPPTAHLAKAELISIGEGTVVEPGAYIQGPCIIGPNNVIRHGAYIRGNVVTGEGCTIGHGTEVKHSILLDGAQAPHFNYVGDSILGRNVNLGAGVKLANLRFDHREIVIHFEGQRISTGLKKLGAVVGDGASLGCNAVSNPGTLIGPKVRCAPCLNIGGVIPEGTIVKENYVSSRC